MTKFLLDAGHGGMAFGHYLTPGKRSPSIPPGVYEGEFNRDICRRIEQICSGVIDVMTINPGPINVSLSNRVNFVNQLYRKEPNLVLLSVHANAMGYGKWNSANGFVVFTARNASKRSIYFSKAVEKMMKDRVDINHRGTKSANFTIISKTKCPAVLLECGFMTNRSDAEKLASNSFRQSVAIAVYYAMQFFKDEKLFAVD